MPWIEDFKPKQRIDDHLQLPIKAHHLIGHTFKAWDEDMVKEIFSPEVAQAILTILIPHHPRQDRLIWLPDPKGTFTIKMFIVWHLPKFVMEAQLTPFGRIYGK